MSRHKHRGTGPTRRLAAEASRSLAKLVAGPAGGQPADQDGRDADLTWPATGPGAVSDPWSALPPPAKLGPRSRT